MSKRGSPIKITEKYILYYILYNTNFAFDETWYCSKQYLLEGIFMVNLFKIIYCLKFGCIAWVLLTCLSHAICKLQTALQIHGI